MEQEIKLTLSKTFYSKEQVIKYCDKNKYDYAFFGLDVPNWKDHFEDAISCYKGDKNKKVFYFTYIKFFIYNEKSYALSSCMSGTKNINFESDLNFTKNTLAKMFLDANDLHYDKTCVLVIYPEHVTKSDIIKESNALISSRPRKTCPNYDTLRNALRLKLKENKDNALNIEATFKNEFKLFD